MIEELRKFFALFRRDGEENIYPAELEESYRISKQIGEGSFAIVRECIDKETEQSYALKIITRKAIKGKENMVKTELGVLKKVDHPNIIKLQDIYESNVGVFIVTELASGGELFNQLVKKISYTEKDAANLVKQMLEGVAYLHDNEIVHRDLKPENLLFKDQSDNAKLMITDFGLSKVLKNNNDVLMTACGTPGYVAPEILLQIGHGKPVDIWSIGVITYILLCGYTPFYGEDQLALFEEIKSGNYEYEDEYWYDISDDAKELINRMLTYDPAQRITAHQALQHDWFKSATNADLENARKNFSAKDRLKRAVHLVRGVNRLRKSLGSNGTENGNEH